MSVVAAGQVTDPPLTLRNALRTAWDANNTPLVGTPSIETAVWDRQSTRPQVCITTRDGVKVPISIATDGIGPTHMIEGLTQVECCAVLDRRLSPVVAPKLAIAEMSAEVVRILSAYWGGLDDLDWMMPGDPGLLVDGDAEPALWKHIITVEWRYFEATGTASAFGVGFDGGFG